MNFEINNIGMQNPMQMQGFGINGGANPMNINPLQNKNKLQQMGINPMCQMNPQMGMNPCMNPQFNPMCQMNPQMRMNPCMNPQFNPMCQMNPMGFHDCMMCKINQMKSMGFNPCMMPPMNPFMMQNKNRPLTEEEQKQIRINGYLFGKWWAEQMNKCKKAQNPQKINQPVQNTQPAKGNITIKFKKGNNVINITQNANNMVAELINEYFEKSHTTNGNFNFNGNTLLSNDPSSLAEVGLQNGSVINVS